MKNMSKSKLREIYREVLQRSLEMDNFERGGGDIGKAYTFSPGIQMRLETDKKMMVTIIRGKTDSESADELFSRSDNLGVSIIACVSHEDFVSSEYSCSGNQRCGSRYVIAT